MSTPAELISKQDIAVKCMQTWPIKNYDLKYMSIESNENILLTCNK